MAFQERLDNSLYEEALMRLQHDKLLLLLKSPVLLGPDQVRAMSDGSGVLMSLKTPMQNVVHTAKEAFVQAERDRKRRGRGPNQERFLVLHGQWSGEKAFDLCQNLQREMRGSITITAAIFLLDAAFQVYLNRLFPTQQEQLIALPVLIELPAETGSKVTYCVGYSVFKVVTREFRKHRSSQDAALIQALDGIQY